MMPLRSHLRRLIGDEKGTYVIEMAIVAPVLLAIIMGIMDFGYRTYMGSVVEGTMNRAARLATVGDQTSTQIDAYINQQLSWFTSHGGTVAITKTNYYQYAGVNKPEKLTTDVNNNGAWDAGDCYEDLNGNGKWDAMAGRTGLGGADDIVYYKVVVTYQRLFPLSKMLGFSSTQTSTASTVMRNQPYAAQAIPPITCTSS
jgi:Flp pilus assembly protein TadG